MNCENVKERLGTLLDGELDAAEEAAVRAHVEACPRCAAELDELESLNQLLGALPAHEGNADFAVRVRRRAEKEAKIVHVGRLLSGGVLTRAAAVLLFAAGVWFGLMAGSDVARADRAMTESGPEDLTTDVLAATPDGSLEQVYLSFVSGGEWEEGGDVQ
ncbi:MAG: zf-HC2 domain-containing protein [Candidatus Brocadiia bacterium]